MSGQTGIDRQVRLIRFKRITSVCFFVHKRTNDKVPFAQWANGLRKIVWTSVFRLKRQHIYIYTVTKYIDRYLHSWASASRKLTAASAFRHPLFQSSTGPKKCRTASAWSSTGSVLALFVLSFQYRTDRVPDSPAFIHTHTNTYTNTDKDTEKRLGHWHGHAA